MSELDADLKRARKAIALSEPIPMWPELTTFGANASGGGPKLPERRRERGRRPADRAKRSAKARKPQRDVRKADLAERRDSLILHKFEAILSAGLRAST